nr:hypothetical protein GCM10020093_112030 [Planobispora longispora]
MLAVGTLALLTRALHLDGLADLADGLGSGRPAERALDIMKRSDIGPFGVVTLLLTLLAQVAALTEAASAGYGPPALAAACVAGRLALTWACREGVPTARPGGLGATVAGTVRRGPALAVTALSLAGVAAVTFVFCLFAPGLFSSSAGAFEHLSTASSPAEPGVFYEGSYAPLLGVEMSETYGGCWRHPHLHRRRTSPAAGPVHLLPRPSRGGGGVPARDGGGASGGVGAAAQGGAAAGRDHRGRARRARGDRRGRHPGGVRDLGVTRRSGPTRTAPWPGPPGRPGRRTPGWTSSPR